MEANSIKMSKVFMSGGDIHYILPHFQREYAWEKINWQTLITDVLGIYDTYDSENEPEHFMGSLVVINDGTRSGIMPAFILVDGQQRLVSISLLLCALGRICEKSLPSLSKKIFKHLINQDEEQLFHFKLLPTSKYGDRAAYLAILQGENPPSSDSKIPDAFQYLFNELDHRVTKNKLDPERLFVVISNCLQVVLINLNQNEKPYKIFESLNAKGKPLSQADLVRNYIAMKLPEAKQGEIFEKYWSVIENLLQERRTVGRSRLGELTAFLRHYLALRNGVLCNEAHVYARFRDRIENDFKTSTAFEEELATLKRFAEHYDHLLRPEKEPDANVRSALSRLNILEISTAYPFLLAAYDSFRQNEINRDEFIAGLDILENYVVRRYLTAEPRIISIKCFQLFGAR